jgi:alpha-tubulin suppressor-like RCC1 family protein
MSVGDNHNLFLTKENILYSNGDNTYGQLDGELDNNFLYYHCAPKRVVLPKSDEVVKILGKNIRSSAMLANGTTYYWGGHAFVPGYNLRHLPRYEGLNIFNNEEGIPEGCEIQDIALGYLHDLVLVNI